MKNLLEENKIDILSMQETEVTGNINVSKLMISNYNLELEYNSVKSRVGFYISKEIISKRVFYCSHLPCYADSP